MALRELSFNELFSHKGKEVVYRDPKTHNMSEVSFRGVIVQSVHHHVTGDLLVWVRVFNNTGQSTIVSIDASMGAHTGVYIEERKIARAKK